MIERTIIRVGIIFGILAFPTLFKRPSNKLWVSLFIINGIFNHVLDRILITTKKLKYPKRFLPRIFKVNVVYDYLVCPYLSVWFAQQTYHDKLPKILMKAFFFTIPQASYEIWLERKTDTMKFSRSWEWYYSIFLVFIVKLISRGVLSILKLFMSMIIQRSSIHDKNT
ncbi:CBO0543 family protein [Bacillus pinisoli]|uniref:CBO0543 family protein n=1 Tax=Bacillus pinisoli TaxID=2901866 RepID=UPI001FF31D3E|nr:CBO0543 family protein [Bacillus pinisoli]